MPFDMVVIGGSAGGTKAVGTVLSCLPEKYPLAVAVVLHRGRDSAETCLAELLARKCTLPVREVTDKETIVAGNVYIGPADYHLMVEAEHFALSTEEPRHYSRPSIDILFETASYYYDERLVGVVLTGANADGSQGLVHIKNNRGMAIVQDPDTAECRQMPEAAIKATKVDKVLPVEEIGAFLATLEAK